MMNEYIICRNCNQEILQSNQIIHELYCVNNIKKCSICEQNFDFNDEEDHLNYHEKQKCPNCKIFQKDLPNHQCIKCHFCFKFFQKDEHQKHLDFCKLQKTKCQFCGQLIQNKQLELHTPYCQEQQEKKVFQCQICKQKFDSINTFQNHQQKCKTKEDTCPYCNLSFTSDFYDHQIACGSRTEECSFCGQRVLLMKKLQHELNCFQNQQDY